MSDNLDSGFDREWFDKALSELRERAERGEPFYLYNEKLALDFDSELSKIYPDHVTLFTNDFQAFCINDESVHPLWVDLSVKITFLSKQIDQIVKQMDWLSRRPHLK